MTVLLEASNLCCERGREALFDALDFSLSPGEILQVTGPNGAGKTSLLRIVATLSAPSSGHLQFRGNPLPEARDDFLAELLYIGHRPAIKAVLSPRENLRWYLALQDQALENSSTVDSAQRIGSVLATLGLQGYEDEPAQQLSAGQLRRVALARLWLEQRALWVLDEPFTSLDANGITQLEAHMQQHVQQGGAILLTSHQSLSLSGVRTLSLTATRRAA